MKVSLGTFACFCIEVRLGDDVRAGVQSALQHYRRRLKSGWPPDTFPDFSRDRELDRSGAEFELPVDREIEAMLEREAQRHGTSIEAMTVHALFVYLADLESGVTPERLPEPSQFL